MRQVADATNGCEFTSVSVACDRVRAPAPGEFQRLYDNLKMRDRDYDVRTNHGRNPAWP